MSTRHDLQVSQRKRETVEALRDILTERARGAPADEVAYEELRGEVLRDAQLARLAPSWLRQTRTLDYWWSYIKPKYAHWDERTAFVREAFEPLLSHLEGVPTPTAQLTHNDLDSASGLVHAEPFGRTSESETGAGLDAGAGRAPHPLFKRPFAPRSSSPPRLFLIHGRQEGPRDAVAAYLRKLMLEVVVLGDQPNRGQTLIEKIEAEGSVDYVVAVITPDDVGSLYRSEDELDLRPRARENVIFELGYFVGRLGRGHVAALLVGDVVLPTDLGGFAYVQMDKGGGWRVDLVRDLTAAGIAVDLSRI